MLSKEGFYLKLSNAAGEPIDAVGNLDGKRNTDDKPAWPLPRSLTEDGARTSMIRRHVDGVPQLGTDASGWISAVNTKLLTNTTSYYRHPDDIGAPGIESGGALPVALSRFRAQLTDAGVSIKWVTESELDNAGFNCLAIFLELKNRQLPKTVQDKYPRYPPAYCSRRPSIFHFQQIPQTVDNVPHCS